MEIRQGENFPIGYSLTSPLADVNLCPLGLILPGDSVRYDEWKEF
jgi:hypothetical protein